MYSPDTQQDIAAMLKELSVANVEELFLIPETLRLKRPLDIPQGLSEFEVFDQFNEISQKNHRFSAIFRGAGAYFHLIPSIVSHISGREEFLTAYTPYQAEISQGVLQAIFEFQTMICELTGMNAANASVYDGATAVLEAVYMCASKGKNRILVSEGVNPQTLEVLRTYGVGNIETLALECGVTSPAQLLAALTDDTACVVLQQPNYFGMIEDIEALNGIIHEKNALSIVSVNPISLGILKTPGECGVDIAVGEGQPLGIPLSFGGPYLGFMACRENMVRKLPGRIVGETVDKNGNRGYVLTLQAREQHIKREKAKSSICSNQALCALRAAVYMAYMGPGGLRDVALHCIAKAHELKKRITEIPGFSPVHDGLFFNEFVTECSVDVNKIMEHLEKKDILGGLPIYIAGHDKPTILWCATEACTRTHINELIEALKEVSE